MPTQRPRIWSLVGSALLMATVEVALTFAVAFDLFLSRGELWLFVATSASIWLGVVFLLHLVTRGLGAWVLSTETRARGLALGASIFSVWVVYGSAGGRRVRDVRILLTFVVAAVVAYVGLRLARRLLAQSPSRMWFRALLLVAAASLAVDAYVLPRLYPVFHMGLSGLALAACVAATLVVPAGAFVSRPVASILFVGFSALAVTSVAGLSSDLNGRFVATNYAPLAGKVVSWLPEPRSPGVEPAASVAQGAAGTLAGPDLRGQSVLLITVDALRADVIDAEHAPNLASLAQESVRFERAYTPTPHTSYALSSLLTGKYLRPVLALPGEAQEHASLPGILRQYGYRTAAFYPPAIFFVDAARFGPLAERGFDFEYRKTMFAPAAARVLQLRRYFEELAAGEVPDSQQGDSGDAESGGERPVFVWVHLFEPHEPYDPPPEFTRGESARARYDGEVAAADDAIGGLIEVFRRARPGGTVIVSADHGEEFGDHGGYHHGTTLYDEQAAVPLIWSTPELEARRVGAPVELVDLATTLLSCMGIPPDARMRGDDLGALLMHSEAEVEANDAAPRFAFAGVGDERMVVDGRYKAICGTSCRLYDLQEDPSERRNLAGEQPERLAELRGALRAFTRSIPEVEAMALAEGGAWPPALAEAELGEGDANALVPLLGSSRGPVRAAAARLLGRFNHEAARTALARMATADDEEEVRREALLAAASMGERDCQAQLLRELEDAAAPEAWRRRAALAMAEYDQMHVPSLVALLSDTESTEQQRNLAATRLAGASGADAELAESALIAALASVNLRERAAESLASFRTRSSANALAAQLANERYLVARTAEASALVQLGDRRAAGLIRRWLGTPEPMPGGVGLLVELGQARRPRGSGWRCDDGCTPGAGAVIRFAASDEPARLVVRAQGPGELRVGTVTTIVHGTQEWAQDVPARTTSLPASGNAKVVAYVLVPREPELPPPPPEPWEDDDAPDAGGARPADSPPE